MQIARVLCSGDQSGTKGPVVNVPEDTDVMVTSLPRAVDLDKEIRITIKQRMISKHAHMSSCTTEEELLPRLNFLQQAPLYKF